MTAATIATLRALLAKATPGPLRINRYDRDNGDINARWLPGGSRPWYQQCFG